MDSPMTIEIAATEAAVEIQSIQPTTNAGNSPNARRAKLYWPPERGIMVPSSDSALAPSVA